MSCSSSVCVELRLNWTFPQRNRVTRASSVAKNSKKSYPFVAIIRRWRKSVNVARDSASLFRSNFPLVPGRVTDTYLRESSVLVDPYLFH
jgi:hypothetical protein